MGRICEILFFVAFVKASPQDEHGVERPALSQGCGGGVAPTSSLLSLLSFVSLQNFLQNPLRRFATFSKNLAIFRLLKTFLSYQQVINNSPFSTQFFENLSADRPVFGTFAQLCQNCITP